MRKTNKIYFSFQIASGALKYYEKFFKKQLTKYKRAKKRIKKKLKLLKKVLYVFTIRDTQIMLPNDFNHCQLQWIYLIILYEHDQLFPVSDIIDINTFKNEMRKHIKKKHQIHRYELKKSFYKEMIKLLTHQLNGLNDFK